MNIHPLIVHFPIALLMLYTFFEVVRVPWFVRQSWYFYIKAVLVTLGTIAVYAAMTTGDWFAESIPRDAPIQAVIEKHEMMASITAVIFSILAVTYTLLWLGKTGVLQRFAERHEWSRPLVRLTEHCEQSRYMTPALIILAIAGAVAVGVTGGLGASMVYGPDIDPFVTIIYKLFF